MERHSVSILQEAIKVQRDKSTDYQNPNSTVCQADYYPGGCKTILDIMTAKMLRIRSVLEAMEFDKEYEPNFESLKDSCIDLINYSSFFASFMDGKIDGQDTNRDFLNRKEVKEEEPSSRKPDHYYDGMQEWKGWPDFNAEQIKRHHESEKAKELTQGHLDFSGDKNKKVSEKLSNYDEKGRRTYNLFEKYYYNVDRWPWDTYKGI